MTSLRKLISGGQTGVDRAALDVAMAAGIKIGGWCPSGRRAEDGVIADRYPLEETPKRDYRQRTEWNVRDSDGTLILYWGELQNGTLATVKFARDTLHRPLLMVNLLETVDSREAARWIAGNDIRTLNVAGPRESSRRGVYRWAYDYLKALLSEPRP